MQAIQYEVSISNGSKAIAKVKVDDRQTGQKQYAPDYSVRIPNTILLSDQRCHKTADNINYMTYCAIVYSAHKNNRNLHSFLTFGNIFHHRGQFDRANGIL